MLIALVVGVFVFGSGVSRTSNCTRCLIQENSRWAEMAGVRITPVCQTLGQRQRRTPREPRPESYEGIFGHPCSHVFKGGGMSWSSLGMIACGRWGESVAFQPRMDALRALLVLYQRLPIQKHAVASYSHIDTLMGADLSSRQVRDFWQETPQNIESLNKLADLLNRVTTEAEWGQVLDFAKDGFTGTPPALPGRPL